MGDGTELAVGTTKNWEWTREYNVQLTDETLASHFPSVSNGDFILLEKRHDDATFSMFGKVDVNETSHLDPGHVGIGANLRCALGVEPGETIRVRDESPPSNWTRAFDRIFGKRPVLCRVRKDVHPDIGFHNCRLDRSTMDELGIAPGDHVVVDSVAETISLKALPARDEIRDRKRRQTAQNPDRYPDPVDVLDLERLAGTDVDIPVIYLDSERREALELGQQAGDDATAPLGSGVCQPVKVTRNATSTYVRSVNEVTVPVVVGLLATIFVFDPWLTPLGKLAVIGLGLLFVLLSVTYRVRTTLG